MERNQSPAEKVKFAEALHKVIEYLQGEPLLLFVLGAVIVLAVAAVSGSQNLWTLILPVILAIAGLLGWIFLETRKNPDSHLRARYEITIEESKGEYRQEEVIVEGRYSKKPPDDSLRLFTVSIDGSRCWPQTVAKIDSNGTWKAKVYLGGSGQNYEIKIVAAVVGQSSRVWWNYYKSVGNVMRENAPEVKRPAVEGWPSDAVIQATAYVTRVFDADRRWNEKKLFDKLRQNVGVSELQIAMQIFDWMRKDGRSLTFGTGRESGSVYPVLRPDGININPVVLSTDGKIWLQFGALQGKPIFGPLDKRRELMSRFGAIRGTSFVDTDLERYPSIALSKVAADPEGLPKLLSTLNWIDDEISSHRFSGGSA